MAGLDDFFKEEKTNNLVNNKDNFNRNQNTNSDNFYERLGIGKTASSSEIKYAWRSLSDKNHPDKTGDDGENQKKINEAYRVLSDPKKRKAYDDGRSYDTFNYDARACESLLDILYTLMENDIRDQSGNLMDQVDPIKIMEKEIESRLNFLGLEINKRKSVIKKISRYLKKIKKKNKKKKSTTSTNFFVRGMESKISDYRLQIIDLEEKTRHVNRMKEILEEYEFDSLAGEEDIRDMLLTTGSSAMYGLNTGSE